MLFTPSFVLSITDSIGSILAKLKPDFSPDDDKLTPDNGTINEVSKSLQDYIAVNANDADIELALLPVFNTSFTTTPALEQALVFLLPNLVALDKYATDNGSLVDASIVDFQTYLNYYNAGSGKFSTLVSPQFAELWNLISGDSLDELLPGSVMCPAIHPDVDSTASTRGMGQRAFDGDFEDGDGVDDTLYAAIEPLLEITTNFADSSVYPTIIGYGLNDIDGDTTTWTARILDTKNPASAVSTTSVKAIVAGDHQLIAIGDSRGIVQGSVLTVSSGLVDEEVVVVEQVGTITLHPDLNSSVSDEAMGSLGVGGLVNLGVAADPINFVGAVPLVEVTQNFADSTDNPVVLITGTDSGGAHNITAATNATPIAITSEAHGLTTGNKIRISGVLGNDAANGDWTVTVTSANAFTLDTSVGDGTYTSGGTWRMTWTLTIGTDNPVTAVSTTITPAITYPGLQTVAVASATGIIVGSVLRIQPVSTLLADDVVTVLAISGTDITARFGQAHLAGAAVTGKTTYLPTAAISGRRLIAIEDISITAADVTAGAIRVVGKQDQLLTALFRKDHAAAAALTGKRTYPMTPSNAGKRMKNLTSISDLNDITDLSAGAVRIVGKQDRATL